MIFTGVLYINKYSLERFPTDFMKNLTSGVKEQQLRFLQEGQKNFGCGSSSATTSDMPWD
jgi:hypothetical protein